MCCVEGSRESQTVSERQLLAVGVAEQTGG